MCGIFSLAQSCWAVCLLQWCLNVSLKVFSFSTSDGSDQVRGWGSIAVNARPAQTPCLSAFDWNFLFSKFGGTVFLCETTPLHVCWLHLFCVHAEWRQWQGMEFSSRRQGGNSSEINSFSPSAHISYWEQLKEKHEWHGSKRRRSKNRGRR